MAKSDAKYVTIIAESFKPAATSGLHGKVHMRPAPDQLFGQDLMIECSKSLTSAHPVGTRFHMNSKLTDREKGGEFLYSYHG